MIIPMALRRLAMRSTASRTTDAGMKVGDSSGGGLPIDDVEGRDVDLIDVRDVDILAAGERNERDTTTTGVARCRAAARVRAGSGGVGRGSPASGRAVGAFSVTGALIGAVDIEVGSGAAFDTCAALASFRCFFALAAS